MDIVEQLRTPLGSSDSNFNYAYYNRMCREAADKIEKLRKEIELLHSIVANVRKDVRDGLYKYEMEKNLKALREKE